MLKNGLKTYIIRKLGYEFQIEAATAYEAIEKLFNLYPNHVVCRSPGGFRIEKAFAMKLFLFLN